MCGIIGIWAKNKKGEAEFEKMPAALQKLSHRGPDNQSIKTYSKVTLGHTRLSVIDPTEESNQPMSDPTDRYHLVFNGEIFNYKEIRQGLEFEGIRFDTKSDTEVLLQLLIAKGENAIEKLNGFFAFIFYDSVQDKMIFARDRMGIKPLVFYEDDAKIILCSELSPLFAFNIEKEIDEVPLNLFFRLTYMPAPTSILKRSYKVLAGQIGVIDYEGLSLRKYYNVERKPLMRISFHEAANDLKSKLTIAVKDRLVSDVPLGTFLSGGIDSSLISAIAKRHVDELKTFSIGFDHPYFDESENAQLVANHIGSNHHQFKLGKSDFQENFQDFLDAIDEPFGDSSAFAMFLLAKETRKHVTVALSGDGADELFGGYRKHRAELNLRMMSKTRKRGINSLSRALGRFQKSRSDKFGDLNRKLQKFSKGTKLTAEERYFEWCSFVSQGDVYDLLEASWRADSGWKGIKIHDMADYLIADQHMVLPNDMLKKVDLMSMRHSLEVRTPFLDHRVVEFANSLPTPYKLNTKEGKLVLKQACLELLPSEILNRKKQGFEIPLQEWLGDQLNEIVNSKLFSKEYIEHQRMFNYDSVKHLVKSLNSNNYGDRIYLLWSLIIFQHWYQKHYD